MNDTPKRYDVRRISEVTREQSTCGHRHRLFTTGDDTPAFAHVVRITESKAHYHKRATEFYYILEGSGTMTIDGETFDISPGTMVKIDPGAVHSSTGDHEVLVIGIPDIEDEDVYFVD